MDKARTCAEIADHLSALKSRYQKQRDDYEFKNAHLLDAQMEECKLHWKEWVCLKRGGSEGFLNYAEQWNESGQELRRKLLRQYEELQDLEKQISALSFWPTCPQTP